MGKRTSHNELSKIRYKTTHCHLEMKMALDTLTACHVKSNHTAEKKEKEKNLELAIVEFRV